MLEKRQESLLSQLEQLHEQQELSVMEMFHQIGNTVEKIERGCMLLFFFFLCFCFVSFVCVLLNEFAQV